MTFALKTIDLGAGTLSYHVAGEGKPVLYLHSAGGVSISEPLKELAKKHRVFAPVAPGFDGTAALPAVATLADYVALVAEFAKKAVGERCDVIGSSFGSWVALWLAVKHPDLVDHLILDVPAGFRFGGKGGLPKEPQEIFKALHAHPERAPKPPKPADILAANGQNYERYTAGVAVDEALAAALPQMEAVTLILVGTEDQVVPAEAHAFLKRTIKTSQRAFIFDAAHAIEFDQPQRVSRLWNAFLEWGQGYVLNRAVDAA